MAIRVYNLSTGNEATVNVTAAVQTYLDLNAAEATDQSLLTIKDTTLFANKTVPLGTLTSDDYSIADTHNDFDDLVATLPAADTYHNAEHDTATHVAGHWKYIEQDNGFAYWTGPVTSAVWGVFSAYWDDKDKNPCGIKVTLTDANAVSKDYELLTNFWEQPPTSMRDVAARFQSRLRDLGAKNTLLKWVSVGAQTGYFILVSPYRGTGATISITAPASGYNLTQVGFPFYAGTVTAGTGVVTTESTVLDRWLRVAAPKQAQAVIDSTKMPNKLVRTTISPLVFDASLSVSKDRPSGDDDSNPVPALWDKGLKIGAMSFWKGRLILGGDEYVVMSATDDAFMFFAEDPTNSSDADPILTNEISVDPNKVALIDDMIQFRQAIIVFTKSSVQFEMTHTDKLTPSTMRVDRTTNYQSIDGVRPVGMGSQIYFVSARKQSALVYEYLYDDNQATNVAVDISAHAEGYIPPNIQKIMALPNDNTLVLLPSDSNELYIYRSWWDGNEKKQSAWSRYTFGLTKIIDAAVIDDEVTILGVTIDGDVVWEQLPIITQQADTGMPFDVLLDGLQTMTGTYDAGTDITTWDYIVNDSNITQVILGAAFTDQAGDALSITRIDPHTVTALGDWSVGDCYLGRTYRFEIEPSQQYPRDRNGAPVLDGRLQLMEIITSHRQAASYAIEISQDGKTTRTKTFTTWKSGVSLHGPVQVDTDGSHKMRIMGRSDKTRIKIISDHHGPCVITGMEIIANFEKRR
ncbi:MAG: hypothetical protein JKX85_15660 [Phycisphaeraceae bacterium]|nr:hypothetical protein [Phycisphaeraceae bacterium]